MSKKIIGKSVAVAYRELKLCGYTVTAFLDGWFRAEHPTAPAVEYEYDASNYITKFSWC